MSSQSSYRPTGSYPRAFYPSQASISSPDPGHYFGATREMGPPSLDFPTPRQPVETEVHSSRTLPNPSVSSSLPWDAIQHGFGGFSDYGSSTTGRPLPVDHHIRGTAPDPLQQWYTGNDGPWIPKGISEIPDERLHSRARTGNRMPMLYGNYRQPNQSDAGSFQFAVPPSDSGYGTRRSDGNASIFSADINERDQDCQSLAGPISDFQTFPGLNEVLQQRDARANDAWIPVPNSVPSDTRCLVCPTCHSLVKTRSELKKHDLRHRKPFVCQYPGCSRTEGFSTTNDLDRHTRSKHPSAIRELEPTKRYRCHVQGCKSKEKSWPRLDNFRSHLKRIHQDTLQTEGDFDDMIRRAESWERKGLTADQDKFSSHGPSLLNPSGTIGPVAHSIPRSRNMEPNWKPLYPEVIEPNQDFPAPHGSPLEVRNKTNLPAETAAASGAQPQSTVQPLDVFRPLVEIRDNPLSLGSILLAPVGITKPATENAGQASPQPPEPHAGKGSPQGKTTRQNTVPASDATITEVIITALAGANIASDTADRNMYGDLDPGSNVTHVKPSSGGSWHSVADQATSSTRTQNGQNKVADSPPQEDSRSLQQRKAIEVLKTLHNLGYIVQKDPSHSPKVQNQGSVASSKSENLVTCQTCKKFKGRPCELKKHMKRHSKPYGCTFLTCHKAFGSKNDWKRHENSQHFHLETWRCDEEKPEGGQCAKVCYRRQAFQEHLKNEHGISDTETVKTKVETCRIGRNCQARFWCGFCSKLIDLKLKGLDAWNERFDHIDDHFMGRRGLTKQGIRDWIPVNSDKPKGDVESPDSLDLSPCRESESHESPSDRSDSASANDCSPASSGATGGSPADAVNLDEGQKDGPKRRRSNSDVGSRKPAKRARAAKGFETVVYCCQCAAAHNPKIDQGCAMCDNSHRFCSSCTVEVNCVTRDES